MRQRGLDDEADPGAGQREQQHQEYQDRDKQHEDLICRVVGGEDREGREVERGRDAVVDRQLAPDDLHHLLDHVGEPEGEEQLRHVAVPVYVAEPVALDERAAEPDDDRGEDERRPEADVAADLEAEEGAQHVEARMGEVEDAHHREDEREAAGHEEEQHPVEDAVQRGDDDELGHAVRGPSTGARPAPSLPLAGRAIALGRRTALAPPREAFA